jgi:hypothetical protein
LREIENADDEREQARDVEQKMRRVRLENLGEEELPEARSERQLRRRLRGWPSSARSASRRRLGQF